MIAGMSHPPPRSQPDPADDRPVACLSAVVHEGVHVIVFPKRTVLDAFEVEPIGRELRAYIERLDKPRIVIDLGTVRQVSSAALGMLVAARTAVAMRGGRVCVAGAGERVREVFRAANFQKVLPVHGSVDDAVASLDE
jgi:anti-anti-sigma factor